MKFLFTKAFCDEFIVINEQNEQAAMLKTSMVSPKTIENNAERKNKRGGRQKHNL